MTDKSRAAFEKWYMSGDLNIRSIHSFDSTYYTSPTTRIAWGAWQASRKDTLEETAEVCGSLFRPSAKLSQTELDAWDIGTLDCETAIKEILNE
jgi:hypothetical protein